MDVKKISEILKNFYQNKNFANILIVLLVIVFLWLATSSFIGGGIKKSNNNNVPKGAQEVATDDNSLNRQLVDYETQQREDIKDILKKMDGVGDVEVILHFESGEVQVPAVNTTTQTSETEEKDREGGTRVTNQVNGGSTVVMSSNGTGNEPFIVKTYKPQITGIFIVAAGAENNKIKYDIQVAISSLYNLSLDKVNVYPMKP